MRNVIYEAIARLVVGIFWTADALTNWDTKRANAINTEQDES